MKIAKRNNIRLQTLKGIALILTGWLLLLFTIIFGGAAYGYLGYRSVLVGEVK